MRSASGRIFCSSLRCGKQMILTVCWNGERKIIFLNVVGCVFAEKYPLIHSVDRLRAGRDRRKADDEHRIDPAPEPTERAGHVSGRAADAMCRRLVHRRCPNLVLRPQARKDLSHVAIPYHRR